MMESSGRRARNGTDQHLRDPTAPLPPSGCARQPLLMPTAAVEGRSCGCVIFTAVHPSARRVPRERPRLESTSTIGLLAGFNINPWCCIRTG